MSSSKLRAFSLSMYGLKRKILQMGNIPSQMIHDAIA